tara:strand:- start:173 stop:616 length:444 start_codon:yes stop_codon:yes gene_type:complete
LLSISFASYVFAQTDNVNANSEKSLSRGKNATNMERPIVIKPVNTENKDPDQENIGRDAMAMIMEITNSNILYEKNKSSANLAFEEQKLKDREKQNNEMVKYNERYNKKYLASFKSFQKMRGKHAGYSGKHSDYSAYLEQFLASNSP